MAVFWEYFIMPPHHIKENYAEESRNFLALYPEIGKSGNEVVCILTVINQGC